MLYRPPLRERLRDHAEMLGSGLLALLGLLGLLVALAIPGAAGMAVATLGVGVLATSLCFLVITWFARMPVVEARIIEELSPDERDPGRCRILTEGERWTLPLRFEELREGESIEVSFRDLPRHEGVESPREVVMVRVVDG